MSVTSGMLQVVFVGVSDCFFLFGVGWGRCLARPSSLWCCEFIRTGTINAEGWVYSPQRLQGMELKLRVWLKG